MTQQDFKVRRLLTEKGANGLSTIRDDRLTNDKSGVDGGFARAALWRSDFDPARILSEPDSAALLAGPLSAGASMIMISHYPAEGSLAAIPFHQHDTLDYVIVLSGEIWLVTEEKETLLRQGDVVIQRASTHTWSNRSPAPCILAFIITNDGTPTCPRGELASPR